MRGTFGAMSFDERTRELARAHDAVDRLRELQRQLAERREYAERRRDYAVRGVMLAVVFVVVFAAFMRL